MVISRALLRMWSDNKTAWWWQGALIAEDREGYVGEMELFPQYMDRNGGTYLLAVQNSNDYVHHENPQGTSYQLHVTWAAPGGPVYYADLPLIVKK